MEGQRGRYQFFAPVRSAQVVLVGQEPVLFSGSVKDNIAYGLRDCEDAQVMAAARAACADDFIGEMTNGINTGTYRAPALPGRGRRKWDWGRAYSIRCMRTCV